MIWTVIGSPSRVASGKVTVTGVLRHVLDERVGDVLAQLDPPVLRVLLVLALGPVEDHVRAVPGDLPLDVHHRAVGVVPHDVVGAQPEDLALAEPEAPADVHNRLVLVRQLDSDLLRLLW
ncbi:hypothetical protein [Streptomyces yangpuensis]|uniref:hypothetical protein n=1 Tax=Streptomyces yangpuensis TaxID=1648182 RepID=UPI00069C5AD1|nr:hypothetical protein [Streptomyces yangpuensis]